MVAASSSSSEDDISLGASQEECRTCAASRRKSSVSILLEKCKSISIWQILGRQEILDVRW